MSLVRYTNKKTGVVTVYESTSHYDPVSKQSRPIRKYLGIEDPKTGEIIPSSGKPGRKKGSHLNTTPKPKGDGPDYKLLYEQQKKECAIRDARIKELERQNKLLSSSMEHIASVVEKAMAFRDTEEMD